MIDIKKIVTLDLEGDGLKKEINQKLFPTGCHIDPNTRIWCATFTARIDGQIRTSTFTTKLNGTRAVYVNGRMSGMTTAEHYDSTVIPTEIDTVFGHHQIRAFKDEKDLFVSLIRNLMILGNKHEIWVKGYNGYKYDYLAIMNSMIRLWPDTNMTKVTEFMNDVPYIFLLMVRIINSIYYKFTTILNIEDYLLLQKIGIDNLTISLIILL